MRKTQRRVFSEGGDCARLSGAACSAVRDAVRKASTVQENDASGWMAAAEAVTSSGARLQSFTFAGESVGREHVPLFSQQCVASLANEGKT